MAGLGTGQHTGTTLATTIPKIWGSRMNDYFRNALYGANFFTDLSSELGGGGSQLLIPTLSAMTANVKTNGSQVTLNGQTYGSVTLSCDTWKEVSFLIEDREAQQVMHSYFLQERLMKNAAFEAAKALEVAIFTLFSDGSFTQTQGTSAASVADSDIRGAIKQLDAANVPFDGRAFFFTPKVLWTDIMSLDRFTLLTNTNGADPVLKGSVGRLYGIPVYETTNLVNVAGSSGSALAHKEAIVWAATLMRTQSQYLQDYLGTLVTADILYGVKVNYATAGVWIKTAS